MAKIVREVSDGKAEINAAYQFSPLGGHWTLWGRGKCLHIYEDNCSLSEEQILHMAKSLEDM